MINKIYGNHERPWDTEMLSRLDAEEVCKVLNNYKNTISHYKEEIKKQQIVADVLIEENNILKSRVR